MAKGITPNYNYLDAKLFISAPDDLKEAVLKKCETLDIELIAGDVEPFLFDASDVKKVTNFADVLRQYSL